MPHHHHRQKSFSVHIDARQDPGVAGFTPHRRVDCLAIGAHTRSTNANPVSYGLQQGEDEYDGISTRLRANQS